MKRLALFSFICLVFSYDYKEIPSCPLSFETKDLKSKCVGLKLILRDPNEIDYAITHNILELFNPETQIRARFF
jgi:hypothetical protein